MSQHENCPFCEMLNEPQEAVDALQFCFAAVGDLLSTAGSGSMNQVDPGNLSLLMLTLSRLHRAAVDASHKEIKRLKIRIEELEHGHE